MTIPAGGPVTGQGINAELGATSTAAVTVNDAYVRGLGRNLSGDIFASDFLGKYGFWIGFSNSLSRSGISVDGNGNVAVATFFSSGLYGVEKYYLSTGLIYARSYENDLGLGLFATQASDGTVVFCATSGSVGSPNIWKLATDGTVVWSRYYKGATSSNNITAAVIDSTASNYYFICGPFDAAINQYTTIVKVNSSGTLQWQVKKTNQQPTSGNLGIARDPSDNIYAVSEQSSPKYVNLMKINSSGSFVWERNLSVSSLAVALPEDQSIAVDGSGNVYLVVATGSPYYTVVVKYNTNGVFQWQTSVSGVYNCTAITCDTSGNVYFAYSPNAATNDLYITKLSTAGAISWQRKLSCSPSVFWTLGGGAANVDAYGNLLLTSGGYIFRLPSSGAGTGSYVINGVTVTYASASLSLAAGPLSDSAGGVGLSTTSNSFTSTNTTSNVRTPTTSSVALNI